MPEVSTQWMFAVLRIAPSLLDPRTVAWFLLLGIWPFSSKPGGPSMISTDAAPLAHSDKGLDMSS
jgi:hypothetical protein